MARYRPYAQPQARYAKIRIIVEGGGRPFDVFVLEHELDALIDRSHEQYRRGDFPLGERFDTPQDGQGRRPDWDEPFFTTHRQDYGFDFRGFYNQAQQDQAYEAYQKAERERKAEEERKQRARQGSKSSTTGQQATPEAIRLANRIRLATLAGVVWPTTLDDKALYKKAQRRCHPDVESGSHELWIELEVLGIYFGFVKDTSRAGRSAG